MTDQERFSVESVLDSASGNPAVLSDRMFRLLEEQALAQLPRAPIWRRAMESIGGVPGLGGLMASVVLGLWIGVAPPDGLSGQLDVILGIDRDLPQMIGFGWDMDEG